MDVFTSHYQIPANGYFLSIMNAASMFGRILPGFIGKWLSPQAFHRRLMPLHLAADKIGRTNTIIPFLTLAGVLLFIFPLCTSVRCPGLLKSSSTNSTCAAARRSHTFRHPVWLCVRRPRFTATRCRSSTGTHRICRRQSGQHDCLPSARIGMSAVCRADSRG